MMKAQIHLLLSRHAPFTGPVKWYFAHYRNTPAMLSTVWYGKTPTPLTLKCNAGLVTVEIISFGIIYIIYFKKIKSTHWRSNSYARLLFLYKVSKMNNCTFVLQRKIRCHSLAKEWTQCHLRVKVGTPRSMFFFSI